MNILQDDKGNYSSMRVILLGAFLVFIFLLFLFTRLLVFELHQESINYSGLATIFTAMVTQVGLVLFLKVFQKKFESDNHKN